MTEGMLIELAHPCRYKYTGRRKASGQYWPIEEDDRGSYIMNSRTLHDRAYSGGSGRHIQRQNRRTHEEHLRRSGRPCVRQAIDAYYADPGWTFRQEWMDELRKPATGSIPGFYGKPSGEKRIMRAVLTLKNTIRGKVLTMIRILHLRWLNGKKMVLGDERSIGRKSVFTRP